MSTFPEDERTASETDAPPAYDFSADLRLENDDDSGKGQGTRVVGLDDSTHPTQGITKSKQDVVHDFAADLKLHDDEDELLGPETPSPIIERSAACGGLQEYDPAVDLRLPDEAEPADFVTPSMTEARAMIEQPAACVPLDAEPPNIHHAGPPHAEREGYITHPAERDGYGAAAEKAERALARQVRSVWENAKLREAEHPKSKHRERPAETETEQPVGAAGPHAAPAGASATLGTAELLGAVVGRAKPKPSAVSKAKRRQRRDASAAGQPAGIVSRLLQLETWLAVAGLALVFQIFPAAFWSALAVVDVRNWTWGVWIGVEVATIVTLLLLRAWQTSDA